MEDTPKLTTLYSEEQIAKRVAEMGKDITEFYSGKPLTVVSILNGAIFFSADLVRKIDLPLFVDSLAISSYQQDKSSGQINFRSKIKLPVAGRHILLLDEILDTGLSSLAAVRFFLNQGAASVKLAVMVQKDLPNRPTNQSADWYGFLAPNRYLVGYGLDSDERFRNLPQICTLDD